MLTLVLTAVFALLFFGLVPGVGALLVRRRWRDFRGRLRESLEYPLYKPRSGVDNAIPGRPYRFFGTLEALQDNDVLWLHHGQNSVAVNLGGESVYQLPSDEALDLESPYNRAVRVSTWRHAGIQAGGIGVFVVGVLEYRDGVPRLVRRDDRPFLVALFDGSPASFLPRALWHGRQINEYWNDFTPASLLIGFALLFCVGLIGFQDQFDRLPSELAIVTSLVPFLPLLPPGILAFFLYRRLWRIGRNLRARKDLVALSSQLASSRAGQAGAYAALRVEPGDVERRLAGAAYHLRLPLPAGQGDGAELWLYAAGASAEEADPMLLPLVVQGSAERRTEAARRKIRLYELAALAALALGMAANYYVAYRMLLQIANYAWMQTS